jgi:hypothetical protein
VLEWYLNSADYGRHAYGADAAARLYFGKSATRLNLAEAALLAAVSQSPAINPHDAPQAAIQRAQETLTGLPAWAAAPQDVERALASKSFVLRRPHLSRTWPRPSPPWRSASSNIASASNAAAWKSSPRSISMPKPRPNAPSANPTGAPGRAK